MYVCAYVYMYVRTSFCSLVGNKLMKTANTPSFFGASKFVEHYVALDTAMCFGA